MFSMITLGGVAFEMQLQIAYDTICFLEVGCPQQGEPGPCKKEREVASKGDQQN